LIKIFAIKSFYQKFFKMKISFYQKNSPRIACAETEPKIDNLNETHKCTHECWNVEWTASMISYLRFNDLGGSHKRTEGIHRIRVQGEYIECYEDDVFRLEFEGKSEYWISKYGGWEQIKDHDSSSASKELSDTNHFKRIFGFDRPEENDHHIPDDNETYGIAAYGFPWRNSGKQYWEYAMGNFDFIWGQYEVYRRSGASLLALYIIEDNGLTERPIKLIDTISFSSERSLRYSIVGKSGDGISYVRKNITRASINLELTLPVAFSAP
jgi:hypothetical protein